MQFLRRFLKFRRLCSFSGSQKKRKFLDNWAASDGHVDVVAEAYPKCSCEDAAPCDSGHGPIADDETLRYFVTSRSDVNLKAKKKKISSAIFARIFKHGVSVVRVDKAQESEVETTAEIQHKNQAEQWGEYGGVIGVVDFKASKVRRNFDDGSRLCCVLDTPIKPDRLAHADLVSSAANLEPEHQKSVKLILFNQIQGINSFVPSADLRDCNLIRFLPDIVKATFENLLEKK